MPDSNELLSVGAQLIGMPLAGPESFSQQQLAYLKQALGVDETVLYSHSTVANNPANTVLLMNEPVTNFERIRVECWNREVNSWRRNYEFNITDTSTSTVFIADMDASKSTSDQQRVNIGISYNSDGNLVDKFHGLFYGNGSSYTSGDARGLGIHKVVGIKRIAGGN